MKISLLAAALICVLFSTAFAADGSGDGNWASIQQAVAQKQQQVNKDQQNIQTDQTNITNIQSQRDQDSASLNDCANQDPPCPELVGIQQAVQQDNKNLQAAQTALQSDSSQLTTDKSDLQQLQGLMAGTQPGGGGGTDSGPTGAKAVAVNLNPAPEDLAKLTGAGGDPGAVAEAAPPQAAPAGASGASALAKEVPMMLGSASSPGGQGPSPLRSAANDLKLGDYQAALKDASEAMRSDPNNPLGYLRAAEAYNHLKDYADAEALAREALKRDPNNAEAWKNLAWALLKKGKYKEALEAALMAVKLKPDMAEAWAIAAYASERLGDLKGRLDYLRKAAELNPAFRGKLELALRGGTVYNDDGSDSLLDELQSGGRERSPLALIALGAALLLLAGGVGVWLWRRRRPAPAATRVMLRPPTPDNARAPQLLTPSGTGRVIGKYELGRQLGRGGMGEVFEAKDLSLGRPVAIKKMAPGFAEQGSRARALFLKEARTVAQLHHPAIVDIYDFLEDKADLYLVFELVSGKTAQQALAESGPLSPKRAREVLKPVCEALDFAHAQAMVHRDIKPANIMLTGDGRVKLMDFGIARAIGSGDATQTMSVVGTPAYMSPESLTGVVSKEGDVYALGVTLYELLTARLPFSADRMAEQKATVDIPKASTIVFGLPPAVDEVIAQALSPAIDKRPRTPGELLNRLSAALI